MARAAEHRAWGIAAGVGAAAVVMPKDDFLGGLVELLGGAIGGRIGGGAADTLEPATTPRHRGVAHSGLAIAALVMVAKARHDVRCREQANACRERASLALSEAEQRRHAMDELAWRFFAGMIVGFLAGYGSHLALDSTSDFGLPLVGIPFV